MLRKVDKKRMKAVSKGELPYWREAINGLSQHWSFKLRQGRALQSERNFK